MTEVSDQSTLSFFVRPPETGALNVALVAGPMYDPLYELLPEFERNNFDEPVFRVAQEGDTVSLSAVAVGKDGRVWFGSDPLGSADRAWGVGRSTFSAREFGHALLEAVKQLADARNGF